MTDISQSGADSPRWAPAWVISLALHLGAVVLLVGVMERAPRGGLGQSDGSIDVVLSPTAASGEAARTDAVSNAKQVVAATEAAEDSPAASDNGATPVAEAGGGTSATHGGDGNTRRGLYGPPGDGQASVRVFGVEGVGSKFVFVFDRSTSMEGPPLATAKAQLVASLRALKPVHQFHIIFFNQQLRHFQLPDSGGRIAFATDRNKQLAARFVGGITADGGTDRLPALRAAIALRPDVVFFLTDADDPMPESELAEVQRLNRRVGATFSTIEFGRGPRTAPINFLTRLAELTGGQYGYVDTLQLRNSPPR